LYASITIVGYYASSSSISLSYYIITQHYDFISRMGITLWNSCSIQVGQLLFRLYNKIADYLLANKSIYKTFMLFN